MNVPKSISINPELNDALRALLAMGAYLVVWIAAANGMGGLPGQWMFTLAVFLPAPVALYALRVGALRMRAPVTAVTEGATAAAAMALAMLALIGSRPGLTGTLSALPATVTAAVIIALTEELIFRGAVLSAISRHFGYLWGIFISALIFGTLHLNAGVGAGLSATLAGVALGGLYMRAGLGGCIVFHAIYNIMVGPIFGLNLGGIPWPGLLEAGCPIDPLDNPWVLLGFSLLALAWLPYQLINQKPIKR